MLWLNPNFPIDPSLMELLAIPLSRQKTVASGWLSRAGGNPVHRKTPAKQVNFMALSASRVVFCWIPDCAGMTDFWTNGKSLLKKSPENVDVN
jgi:hypothetical protein